MNEEIAVIKLSIVLLLVKYTIVIDIILLWITIIKRALRQGDRNLRTKFQKGTQNIYLFRKYDTDFNWKSDNSIRLKFMI